MKIAIAGYGLEGEQNYQYWNTPENDVTIADANLEPSRPLPEGARTILGPDAFERLESFDVVVRTAGLAPYKIKTDGTIWSATNEFFEKCPAPIIGVTGTKGKGTTSSMIASMLRAAGKTVHLVGNIGVPALPELASITPSDIVVFEMSSFQLWDIKKSPQVAVVLMVEPDHLNVHVDFDDYVDAKANIRRYQAADDFCVYHPTNANSHRIAAASSAGTAARYAVVDDGQVYVRDDAFYVNETRLFGLDALQLPGAHNVENACAGISAALRFVDNYALIEKGLRDFEGLPHRLEFVRELDQVKFYNDSFSSAPGATVAAIRAFTAPEIVILGGIDKGADFSELAETIKVASNVKQLIIIGDIRDKLSKFLLEQGVTQPINSTDVRTMPEIITLARNYAAAGDIVILSPGCASFDMFKDFYDRGTQFRELVRGL